MNAPDPAHRLIDANANRAREALRVMEDVARFGLDDGDVCGALKDLRHDLRAALDAIADRTQLLASRDTEGDVGTAITTEAEGQRTGLRDVALAAGARLTEALRAVEEAAKTLGGGGAERFEALRYRAYTLEQRLGLAMGTGRARQWKLCVLITESLCTHRPWLEVARAAIEAGADCLQLREKTIDGRELLTRARALVELARGKASVIINDRPDIALLARADGVHLGQSDLSVRDVRTIAGDRLLVGVSTTSLDEARAAVRAGADYCGVGPMFATSTKKKRVAGPEYLRQYLADPVLAARPHLAIGGITPENARELAAAGCRGIAVSSAVCSARDPAAACRDLLAALG